MEYEDRINAILAQDAESRSRAARERRVEGQPLTLNFPRLLAQRVVGRHSVWFEAAAEPKVEYIRKTVVRGLIRRKPRDEVETKRYTDRFAAIRILVRTEGWPERLHVLRPHEQPNVLTDVMGEALRDLEVQVRLVLREENPD